MDFDEGRPVDVKEFGGSSRSTEPDLGEVYVEAGEKQENLEAGEKREKSDFDEGRPS